VTEPAAAESSGDEASVVDWSGLEARFKGKTAFVDRLAATALGSHGADPENLRGAAVRQDFQTLAFLAHRIKGMAGNMMAPGIFELAREGEAAARQARSDAVPLAEKLASAVEGMLAEMAMRLQREAEAKDRQHA
jgi:HPt (histidine-containing phosphotransfer) domain-containing protein